MVYGEVGLVSMGESDVCITGFSDGGSVGCSEVETS